MEPVPVLSSLPSPSQFNQQFALTPGISRILGVFYKIHRYWRWQKYYRDVYGNNGENISLAVASRTIDYIVGKETLLGKLYTGVGWTLLVARCVLNTLQAYRQLSKSCAIFKEHWRGNTALHMHIYTPPKAIQALFGKAAAQLAATTLVHVAIRIYHLAKMVLSIAVNLFIVSQHLIELGEALLLEKEIKQEARQMMLINLKSVLETITQSKEGLLRQIEQNNETICQFVDKIAIPGINGEQVIALTKKGIEKTEQAGRVMESTGMQVVYFLADNANNLISNMFGIKNLIPVSPSPKIIVARTPNKHKIHRAFNSTLN